MENITVADELLKRGGILIGSRALYVHDEETSDYDIAIHIDNLPESYKNMILSNKNNAFDIKNYFNLKPPLGNGWVIKKFPNHCSNVTAVDILIFDSKESINNISDTISELLELPKDIYIDKSDRISIFESRLKEKLWKRNE